MGADVLDVERAADHRLERLVGGIALRDVELGVAQVTDARGEAEAQQVHQRKDVVREPGRVGVVLLDLQVGFVVQQAVEHVGRVATPTFTTLVWNGAYWSQRYGYRTSALGCCRISG